MLGFPLSSTTSNPSGPRIKPRKNPPPPPIERLAPITAPTIARAISARSTGVPIPMPETVAAKEQPMSDLWLPPGFARVDLDGAPTWAG